MDMLQTEEQSTKKRGRPMKTHTEEVKTNGVEQMAQGFEEETFEEQSDSISISDLREKQRQEMEYERAKLLAEKAEFERQKAAEFERQKAMVKELGKDRVIQTGDGVVKGTPSQPTSKVQASSVVHANNSQALAQPLNKTTGSTTLPGDFLVPRVLLMQSTSELVKSRKAYAGQIVRSPDGEVLGGIFQPGEPAKTIDVLPLKMGSSWTIVRTEGNKWKRVEPRTAENDMLPWEFVDTDGEECKRLKTIDLVGLLVSDMVRAIKGVEGELETLDDGVLMPVGLSFKSTSFNAGKYVSTYFTKLEMVQKERPYLKPYDFTMTIGCTPEENDLGSYFVLTASGSRKSDPSFKVKSEEWYQKLLTTNVRIEDEETSEARVSGNTAPRNAVPRNY